MTDWGVPDWTDAGAYGETNRWTFDRWRWEFTRRRGDYRAEFEERVSLMRASFVRTRKHDAADATIAGLVMIGDPELAALSDDDHKNIESLAWADPDAPGFRLETADPRRYGMYDLFNPRFSENVVHIQFYSGVSFGGDPTPDECGVLFDLRLPIAPQLQAAAEYLLDAQHRFLDPLEEGTGLSPRRRHPAKWLSYLRVLDGREAGASWREVFDAVLADAKAKNKDPVNEARNTWKAARDLMFNWPA